METQNNFFASWDQYMYIGGIALVAIAILILLYHELRISMIKDYKAKYDHVNLHEIRYFWYAVICLIAAAAFFANTIGTELIAEKGLRWFYVRMFITLSFALIAYFIFYSVVRIYYPRQLEKRLHKFRTKPRKSPDGNLMRRLSEAEEDHHLEADQIQDEALHVVDYDVWIDDKTGFKRIEKYPIYQHAEECPECGYYTMKISQEEIEKAPTEHEPGILIEHYRCHYCKHREQREVVVAKLSTNVA